MTTHTTTRPARASDVPALRRIVEEIGLFPSELLADMIAPFLDDPARDTLWLVAEAGGRPAGLCYAAHETMTEGTWNMRALGIRPGDQRKGVGATLTAALESALRDRGQRILIVDTSSTDDFAIARAFYARQSYREAARLPHFWAEGDDKVTFWKDLCAV
ncbi:GNAT family N-acetyltransferase [Aestuariibius sp. 2305UL40-4]|uniref:GNAT family N-acetyltransferase n=1 Tax=Aestuariibius violaceus TaxID=3234132 RepID=UPI00345EAEC3